MLKDATDLSLEDNDSQRLSGKQGNQVNIYFFHLFFQCHYNFAIIFNFVLSNIYCFYLFKIKFLFAFSLHFVGLAFVGCFCNMSTPVELFKCLILYRAPSENQINYTVIMVNKTILTNYCTILRHLHILLGLSHYFILCSMYGTISFYLTESILFFL